MRKRKIIIGLLGVLIAFSTYCIYQKMSKKQTEYKTIRNLTCISPVFDVDIVIQVEDEQGNCTPLVGYTIFHKDHLCRSMEGVEAIANEKGELRLTRMGGG